MVLQDAHQGGCLFSGLQSLLSDLTLDELYGNSYQKGSNYNTSFYVYGHFVYMYVCAPHADLMPMEAKRDSYLKDKNKF